MDRRQIRHDLILRICVPSESGAGLVRCAAGRWVAYEDGESLIVTDTAGEPRLLPCLATTLADEVLSFLLGASSVSRG